ncbi:MAG: TIGR04255 family protein [Bacteroidota bacterium]|nr:TIGR04255 family protein [Bacteroidota bacterium]
MEAKKIYKNPPLVEAVFELFYSSSSWSPIIPGMFFNEVRNRFPNITQNQGGFGIAFDNKGLKIGSGNGDLTQFKNANNDTIIQLSGNLLTVNKLPIYNGWDSFLEVISFAIDALKRVVKIDRVDRIGLKTINKVDIKGHSLEQLKKYFTIYPNLPLGVNSNLSSIQINLESPLIEKVEILAISLVTLRKEPNYEAPVMFQLYLTRVAEIPEDFIDWLMKSHKILSETFENSLTEYCKNQFDNV